jgi:hypothetical protein
LRKLVVDDSIYDNASWYRRHRGDAPIAAAEDAAARAAKKKDTEPALWNLEDVVEYSECGEVVNGDNGGVFGAMFE